MARINCLIVGCQRTCKNPNNYREWICAKHWSVIPKIYRRLFNRVSRDLRKRNDAPTYRRFRRIWEKCVDQATQNAGYL